MVESEIRWLIIAGPQASGKTIVFNELKDKYLDAEFLEEVNPFNLFGPDHKGGAFVTVAEQELITGAHLARTASRVGRKGLFIEETGPFGLVYLEKNCGTDKAEEFFGRYLAIYQSITPTVFFIDTPPEVSWERRAPYYELRINGAIQSPEERAAMRDTYKQFLTENYNLWIKWFEKMPFREVLFKNSNTGSQKEFLEIITREIGNILEAK